MDRQVYDRMRLIEADHWWFRGRRRILAGLIADLGLPNGARILEVGCGTGGNLAMLSGFGQVVGLEPDADSRAYAGEKTGVCVKGGALPDDLPFAPDSFDLVCAFDVIEHVEGDAAALAALAGLAKPGGRVAATVPAHPWMWSRHDELHHHKRRYTLSGFRRLVEGAGLEVERASYFNTLLFAPIAAVRLAKLLTGARSADDDSAPPGPANDFLGAVFGSESAWLKRAPLPFGVSIALIARRPL
jgi:SAM-dependent methyltransferase